MFISSYFSYKFEISQLPNAHHICKTLSMLQIPTDKDLVAIGLVETHTKLEELIPAAMFDYGLKEGTAPHVVAEVPD